MWCDGGSVFRRERELLISSEGLYWQWSISDFRLRLNE
jgi:hypothetical protein